MLVTRGILLAALLAAPPTSDVVPPSSTTSGATTEPAPGASTEPPRVDDPHAKPPTNETPTPGPATASGIVLDRVLPSGMRVLVARDESLPVAAVVLAIETGLEEDAESTPGLTHALAHHLQQGNRQLRPGAALDTVHGRGGLAMMAVGARQVRFESLVPAFALQRVLEVEAIRLVHPTLDDGLWQRSLDAARRDRSARPPVDETIWATVWGRPSLAFAKRARDTSLAKLPATERASAMQRSFDPRRATLIVVAPDEPRDTLAAVETAFSSLPLAERTLPPSPQLERGSDGPREVSTSRPSRGGGKPKSPSTRFVAPVHTTNSTGDVVGDAESLVLARVLCGTLNRQADSVDATRGATNDAAGTQPSGARDKGAPRERVRCRTFEDPRRPLLVVDVTTTRAARDVLGERLRRIANGDDAPLLETQRERQRAVLELEVQTPLGLARTLALSAPIVVGNPNDVQSRPWTSLVGLAALADPNGLQRVLGRLLEPETWWQIVEPPSTEGSNGGQTGSTQPPSSPATAGETSSGAP